MFSDWRRDSRGRFETGVVDGLVVLVRLSGLARHDGLATVCTAQLCSLTRCFEIGTLRALFDQVVGSGHSAVPEPNGTESRQHAARSRSLPEGPESNDREADGEDCTDEPVTVVKVLCQFHTLSTYSTLLCSSVLSVRG